MTAGVYIHIPFCRSRCSYCDFATGLYESELAERYVATLVTEIGRESKRATIDTIYFGGGTPSLLSPAQLDRILETVRMNFDVAADSEITMEMNPGTVTLDGLKAFRQLGINRASFGAQTFSDHELARLGRSHTSAETLQTYDRLRSAGFDNVSLDLIAGLPGQSLDQWKLNVDQALNLGSEHLSFYLLEVHEGTPLAEHIRKGKQPNPDDDLASEMYERMLERSAAAGYQHYEISNLCLPSYESRHNSKYWTGAAYYGFGCSSHSYDGLRCRWSNERDVAKYVKLIGEQGTAVVERTDLDDAELRSEAVFLGMRMMQGVNARDYEAQFGVDLRDQHRDDLNRFVEAGLLQFEGDMIRLTRAGALMSNEVFSAFI